LNDITSGSNPGCGTDGFNATVGWDPVGIFMPPNDLAYIYTSQVTGLGTPNFMKLQLLVDQTSTTA